MRFFKMILILGILVSSFFVERTLAATSVEMKVGFVDFEKVFNSYKKTRDENQKLQRYKEEKEKALQSFIEEVNSLKAESEILSAEAKLTSEKNIKDKLRELRDYKEDINQDLLERRNVMFQKITDEIRQVIEAKGKQDHFTLIMDDKALFYKESALDLTQSVIELLNVDTPAVEVEKATK
jgi:Skp family chaperone for outer membrane proteins